MRPVVNGLEQKYADQMAFASVDYYNDTNRELSEKYKVFRHPTFVVVDKTGNVVESFAGDTQESALEQAIKQAVGTSS